MLEVGMMVYFMGMMSLLFGRFHLLSILLSFEMMMLGVFLMMVISFIGCLYSLMTYLTFVVCEASMGLAIVVVSVYYYGDEYVNSFSVLQC